MATPEKSSLPKAPLKDPFVAAVLAFLLPGLGHIYQGRLFKGLLYGVCILGTFAFGMRLGDGKVVYFNWHPEQRTWAYLCQFWAGLPAIPALLQAQLRDREAFQANLVPQPIKSQFDGRLSTGNVDGALSGELEIGTKQDDIGFLRESIGGTFKGTLQSPKGNVPVTGRVTDVSIEPRVAPDRRRRLVGTFEGQAENHVPGIVSGRVQGSIPRVFFEAYEAPMQDDKSKVLRHGDSTDLEQAHYDLGTRFELGVIYTMIAGLLNILAIYDALDGPAYEDDEEEPSDTGTPPSTTKIP